MYHTMDTIQNVWQTEIDKPNRAQTVKPQKSELVSRQEASEALVNNLETLFATARPRLLRFARKHGVHPDAADDVVQETMIEAWRHLDSLRSSERFDSWLYGICRNVCYRWEQAQDKTMRRQTSLSKLLIEDNDISSSKPCNHFEEVGLDRADPFAPDPIEELSRQELATLLDHALGHLPGNAREALKLCYLEELPQHETALRLGLTINALEVRLHRARHQLRQVLSGALRPYAQEFGLTLDEEEVTTWRETRMWCMFCGRHHLQGRLDTLPDGRVSLRLRCPNCRNRGPREWIRSGGTFELQGLKSFRPAFNRLQQVAVPYWTTPPSQQVCLWCGARVQRRLLHHNEPFFSLPPWEGLKWAVYCPACGSEASNYLGAISWRHLAAQHFMDQHQRWINEPEKLIEHAGQPVFCVRLADITSSSRLTLLIHYETLQVLETFQE